MDTRFRSRLMIAIGASLLALPPLLVRIAPDLPVSVDTPWRVPETLATTAPAGPRTPRIRAEPLQIAQHLLLQTPSRGFVLQRNTYSVRKLDDDLVPWLPDLANAGWINMGTIESDARPWISVMTLQSSMGTSAQVLAWTYRVGPYLSRSFNVAKLLQIPAKLGGANQFELISISASCLKDCADAASESAALLSEIVEENLERH